MKNRKAIYYIFAAVFFINSAVSYTQSVDVEELKKNLKEGIVFINYTGKHKVIESGEEITGIGKQLATLLRLNGKEGIINLKYSVFHAVDKKTKKGLDADVISIDREATVDHIDNIRRIISGYLEAYYGYSEKDADLLSKFITIYNAVFRGNLDFFRKVYKPVVMSFLSKENAGLSTKYFEWPGKTRMVIPLTPEAGNGSLSSISTSQVTEKKVIEQMRSEKGKGLKERKAMVGLKEREVTEKSLELLKKQEELKKAKREKAALEAKLAEEKRTLEEKKKSGTAGAGELAKKEAKVKKLEEEIKTAGKEVETTQEAVAGESKVIEQKNKEIEAERKQIAKDQAAVLAETGTTQQVSNQNALQAKSISDTLYYLTLGDSLMEGSRSWNLIIIDPESGKITKKASGARISEKNLQFSGGKVLLTVYADSSRKAAKLILLDARELTMAKSSKENIYPYTYILNFKKYIYAVISRGGSYFLGKFNDSLKLVGKSKTEIAPDSYITVFNNSIYANSKDGFITVMDADTLKQVSSLSEK
ncbi:MAG: hypothetical protein DRP57_13405 [Spirochaetes bacterium]|nr:MAG: hypothetical protein DRP57_13405 [Spirochaetota bacterium]